MVDLYCEYIGSGKHKKKRRRFLSIEQPDLIALQQLPADWLSLLMTCLKNGRQSRWETWQKLAGLTRKILLDQLYAWLLRHGWIIVHETFRNGDWWPYKIEWQHEPLLRKSLGLPVASEQASQLQQLLTRLAESQSLMQSDALQGILALLAAMPVNIAIRRATLIHQLFIWQTEQRTGSYRDFSLFARQTTKSISSSEWQWLESVLELAHFGIQPHTPLLYLSADLILTGASGSLALSQAKPFAAFVPASIFQLTQVQAKPALKQWICIENLTSFERIAAKREPNTAVLWIPGFPPSWWQSVVSHLLKHCPASLLVACDPDPAGIRIAQIAIDLWKSHGLSAQPWRMQVKDLNDCKKQLPLTDLDRQQLVSIAEQPDLHPDLAMLVSFMQQHQYKAEQESYL